MRRLLRLYSWDFFKKNLFFTGLACLAGFVFLSPLAANIQGKVLFTNWVVYIALYGVYFYAYPLGQVSKWCVNLPVSKAKLVWFNIIFQMSKIVQSLSILLTILYAESYFFPGLDLFEDSQHAKAAMGGPLLEAHEVDAVLSGPLPSTLIVLFLLIATFFVGFMFNVAPYEPFKGGLRHNGLLEVLRFHLRKSSHRILPVLGLFGFLYLFSPYYYSSAMLGAFAVVIILGLLYFTYNKLLLFKTSTTRSMVALLAAIFVFLWGSLLGYSKLVLRVPKISVRQKIDEYEFSGKRFLPKEKSEIVHMLEDKTLCSNDISRVLQLMDQNKVPDIFFTEYLSSKTYPEFIHPFKQLDFGRMVLDKEKKCGLIGGLGLFKMSQLSFQQIDAYIERWTEISNYDFSDQRQLVQRLRNFQAWSHEIEAYLKSQHPVKNQLGLAWAQSRNSEELLHLVVAEAKHFNVENLGRTVDWLGHYHCRIFSVQDVLGEKKIVGLGRSDCRAQRKIASILK